MRMLYASISQELALSLCLKKMCIEKNGTMLLWVSWIGDSAGCQSVWKDKSGGKLGQGSGTLSSTGKSTEAWKGKYMAFCYSGLVL